MIGKMGSGKTACMVREIVRNENDKTTFSNIIIKGKSVNNIVQINKEMIIKKELDHTTRDGRPIYKYSFNDTFWKESSIKGINVVLDEAHTLVDSRRAMSKINGIMNDFIALLRRILGDTGDGYGELILITQLGRRLDVNARELATSIHYHIAHYTKTCNKCGWNESENNEKEPKTKNCPRCNGYKFTKHRFVIEKWEFASMEHCDLWIENLEKTYYKHYYITDIEEYFKYYNTFQWENLITDDDY